MMRWGYVEIAAAFGLCLCLSHLTASAEPAYVSVVRKYVETTVKPMVNVAIVKKAIEAQIAILKAEADAEEKEVEFLNAQEDLEAESQLRSFERMSSLRDGKK